MFVNWGIESAKWKLLIKPLEEFTFSKAVRSVLAGCSVTMLTPNRIGEYGGRVMYVGEENRLKAISVTILGSISQLAVTMLVGAVGLWMLISEDEGQMIGYAFPWLLNNAVVWLSALAGVLLLLVYFRIHLLIVLIGRIKMLRGLIKYVDVVDLFSRKQLLRILNLSFLRYLVFILQYVLLLKVMGVELPGMMSFWMLSIFYLTMVLLPTIGFIELPLRAITSVKLLGIYSSNVIGIQTAAFGIWLVNLVIPAIVGSLLIMGIKIMKVR